MPAAPGFSRSRSSMYGEISMPETATPRSASGTATRPVPTGPDRQLESPSVASQAGQDLRGRRQQAGVDPVPGLRKGPERSRLR